MVEIGNGVYFLPGLWTLTIDSLVDDKFGAPTEEYASSFAARALLRVRKICSLLTDLNSCHK